MDGDDVAVLSRFERQITGSDRRPSIGLLGGAMTLTGSGRCAVRIVKFPCGDAEIRLALEYGNCFAHTTVMMRKHAFEEVGGYRTTFRHAEDYDLWLRIGERYQMANLRDPLVSYRLHEGQVSMQEVEQQALSCLGAQLAAKIRRATSVDRISEAERATRELLRKHGVTNETIDNTVLQHYLVHARHNATIGNEEGSRRILLKAAQFCRTSSLGRHQLSNVHLLLARSYYNQRSNYPTVLVPVVQRLHALAWVLLKGGYCDGLDRV